MNKTTHYRKLLVHKIQRIDIINDMYLTINIFPATSKYDIKQSTRSYTAKPNKTQKSQKPQFFLNWNFKENQFLSKGRACYI